MRSGKNSASGDPAGYVWLLVSRAQRYATGTRTTTVVNIAIHMGGMVSPAPRMMPPKTWETAMATYPAANMRICLTPRRMISSVVVNMVIRFLPNNNNNKATSTKDVVKLILSMSFAPWLTRSILPAPMFWPTGRTLGQHILNSLQRLPLTNAVRLLRSGAEGGRLSLQTSRRQ